MPNKNPFLLFLAILTLAAFFRFYGVNWDQNQHLHPDERFLTMVTEDISWPKNLLNYLDTEHSPLNPHNKNYSFFVYGTFPVFLTKYIAETVNKADYNGITLVGRKLSALFDLGTVILVFLITRQIIKSLRPTTNYMPHLAMLFYATLVLPIQLSHFYTVETYLTFFIILSFYFLIKIINSAFLILNSIFLGISFGLAHASKISALLFLPIIGIGFIYLFFARPAKPWRSGASGFLFLVSCLLTLRLSQPYLFVSPNLFDFSLNQKVLDNWKELKSFDDATGGFPPAVQWITTKPYIFPLKNMIFWGLGLPLGIISLSAVIYQLIMIFYHLFNKKFSQLVSDKNLVLNLSLLWILILFIYQGKLFVKPLRYFSALYPFLALLAAWLVNGIYLNIRQKKQKFFMFSIVCFLLLILIYPVSFASVYTRPHTRIKAAYWIYQNIPSDSVLSAEDWDDSLPMSLPEDENIREKYQFIDFPLFWPDDEKKWNTMSENLNKVDYIILSSNRVYGSTGTLPEKYSITIRYYNALFDNSLGFVKVAEFTSRPNLPFPFVHFCLNPPGFSYGIVSRKSQECPLTGISFVDDYADETFTVYDHPKVIIFKKVKPMNVNDYNSLFMNHES